MSKKRLDVLLVERKLMDSREKAKRVIMAGLVFSESERLDKPGMQVPETIPLHIKGDPIPYVSRGGLKLEKALKHFHIKVKNKIMIDVGSSTGGFTDCALQKGATLSYAIDVGYNQLDWKLRNDERVVVMERTNFRYVTAEMLEKGLPNFASVDVSFISLKLILPVLKQLLTPNSDVVLLIKPQFEAGREQVGKKGIISDPNIHREVLQNILLFAQQEAFIIQGLTFSPIMGGGRDRGNIEFLAHIGWQQDDESSFSLEEKITQVIEQAHEHFK